MMRALTNTQYPVLNFFNNPPYGFYQFNFVYIHTYLQFLFVTDDSDDDDDDSVIFYTSLMIIQSNKSTP